MHEQIKRGADWIKLFPTGGYSFTATGQDQYEVTYPMPVLQALIDETHHLGKKAACHVLGGEGQRNAIVAGCDTIEHGFGLHRDEIDMMAAKGIYYDPTFVRYTEPYMDDEDDRNTGGKYRIIPISNFCKSCVHGGLDEGTQNHDRWRNGRFHQSSRDAGPGV